MEMQASSIACGRLAASTFIRRKRISSRSSAPPRSAVLLEEALCFAVTQTHFFPFLLEGLFRDHIAQFCIGLC